jgi:uncharacterized protein (TIRG00374 family)
MIDESERTVRRHLWIFLKVCISIALLAIIFWKFDLSLAANRLKHGNLLLATLALVCVTLNVPLVACRWLLLVRRTEPSGHMTFKLALNLTWIGLFFSQVLPGGIGGDVGKGWLAYRTGFSLSGILSSIVADRIVAIMGLIIIVAALLPSIISVAALLPSMISMEASHFSQISSIMGATALLIVVCISAVRVLFKLFTDIFKQLIAVGKSVYSAIASRNGGVALLLSMTVHCITTISALLIAAGLGIPLSGSGALLAIPMSNLVASLPISIGGWGVREASTALILGMLGVSYNNAVTISIVLGASIFVSALPGGVLWMLFPDVSNDRKVVVRAAG